MEYEVVNIVRDTSTLQITVQHPNGKREMFGYPLGEGWEEEDSNGDLRAVKNIEFILKDRVTKQAKIAKNFDIDIIKSKHVGKKIKDKD